MLDHKEELKKVALEWRDITRNDTIEGGPTQDDQIGQSALRYFSGSGRYYLDTMEILYRHGPVQPGELLGGRIHLDLVEVGLAAHVTIGGEDGYYALTGFGGLVYNAYLTTRDNQWRSISASRYVCHKEVYGIEIAGITEEGDDKYYLTLKPVVPTPVDTVPSLVISKAEYDKFKPQKGWWVVIYDSGYRSFSPGPDFVNGYTLKE